MGTIISISGVSGSGKTTLADHLLSLGPQYRIIESSTTRAPRKRDRPDEFLYLSADEFKRRERENKFLWVTPPIHGTCYGMLRESVEKALTRSGVSVMVITIECLPVLLDYAGEHARNVIGIYIRSQGETTLRLRLSMRMDSPQDIDKRIIECRDWDARADGINKHMSINFLNNKGTLDEFFAEAEQSCRL